MDGREAIDSLESRLAGGGYRTERTSVTGRDALVARRSDFHLRWFATRLHTFVVVFVAPELDDRLAEELTAAAQQYAIEHKGGLPRGLQTGSATVAVFVSEVERPVVRPWFSRRPKHRFAALRFPVLVELGTGTLSYFRGRMTVGGSYASHLRAVVEEMVAPSFQPPRG